VITKKRLLWDKKKMLKARDEIDCLYPGQNRCAWKI